MQGMWAYVLLQSVDVRSVKNSCDDIHIKHDTVRYGLFLRTARYVMQVLGLSDTFMNEKVVNLRFVDESSVIEICPFCP